MNDDLTEAQLAKVQKLLDKLNSDDKISANEKLEKLANLVNKYRRNNVANSVNASNSKQRQPEQRSGRRKNTTIVNDDDIDFVEKTSSRRQSGGRRRSDATQNRENGGNRLVTGKKNVQCRSEEVYLTGENKFDKMRERDASKADIKIDKLLWGDSAPEPRRDQIRLVRAKCRVCNDVYETNPSFITMDVDGEYSFICDGCCVR